MLEWCIYYVVNEKLINNLITIIKRNLPKRSSGALGRGAEEGRAVRDLGRGCPAESLSRHRIARCGKQPAEPGDWESQGSGTNPRVLLPLASQEGVAGVGQKQEPRRVTSRHDRAASLQTRERERHFEEGGAEVLPETLVRKTTLVQVWKVNFGGKHRTERFGRKLALLSHPSPCNRSVSSALRALGVQLCTSNHRLSFLVRGDR